MLRAGAEEGADGWTLDGFRDVGESETIDYDNYYVASNRQYVSYDQYLKSGPYNFGDPNRPTTWAEHFPYQDGLIVSYWDIRGQAAQPLFDDRREYWSQVLPRVGVKVPHVGVRIRVLSQNGTSMRIRVQPAPAAAARD
jgi:Immune inhibitor A-like metallopeptidase, VEG domain